MSRRGLLLLAATALSTLPALAQAPQKGGTLSFAVVAEPPNYDCHASTTFALIHPIAPHYSTLLKFDGAKYPAVAGDLAKSWTIAPDGKRYTFALHQPATFHDGTPLTSADIKASYERIARPPQGVISARRAFWADLDQIETPDAATVSFTFKSPVAGMLEHFANPYNCIYSAAKLTANPKYPETEIMGSGAFRFVAHTKGASWEGAKFDKYFRPGLPHLDGFKAFFVKNTGVVPGLLGGQFQAEFRGQNPKERDQLMADGKDRFVMHEGTWVGALLLVFNTKRKPFDDVRVRQAISMGIDRRGGSAPLSKISILKGVGGVLRPGSDLALPDAELEKMPGWGKDIEASRAEARKLLKEAGVENLTFKLLNRNVAEPYTPPAFTSSIRCAASASQPSTSNSKPSSISTAPRPATSTSPSSSSTTPTTTRHSSSPNTSRASSHPSATPAKSTTSSTTSTKHNAAPSSPPSANPSSTSLSATP
jgi:peptide/nickel transport system substrate-binding protein